MRGNLMVQMVQVVQVVEEIIIIILLKVTNLPQSYHIASANVLI